MGKCRRQFGFTLFELLVVCAVVMILAAVAVMNVQSMLKEQRVSNACNMTLTQLRLARQKAMDQRRIYLVRFQAPRTIQLYQVDTTSKALTVVGNSIDLPFDVEYRYESGLPADAGATPDNFKTHNLAIDFAIDYSDDSARTDVRFYPDGSARDSQGRMNNGVIYMAHPGELMSSRAVSLFGATGRAKAWRLSKSSGTLKWQ